MFVALLGRDEDDRQVIQHLYDWIQVGHLDVGMDLLYDPLTALFLLLITGVGSLIHVYSIGYMEHDPRRRRFFGYLNLFVAAMLMLVMSENYLGLFLAGLLPRWLCAGQFGGLIPDRERGTNVAVSPRNPDALRRRHGRLARPAEPAPGLLLGLATPAAIPRPQTRWAIRRPPTPRECPHRRAGLPPQRHSRSS